MKPIDLWEYQVEELDKIRKDYPILGEYRDVVGHLIRSYKVVKGQLDDWGREVGDERD